MVDLDNRDQKVPIELCVFGFFPVAYRSLGFQIIFFVLLVVLITSNLQGICHASLGCLREIFS